MLHMDHNILLKNGEYFSDLYERNVKMIYRIALMHLKVPADAEDAVQTVFLKYLNVSPEFDNQGYEKAWFITTTRNYCRDILKCWWHSRKTDSDISAVSSASTFDCGGEVTQKLMQLPEKYKDILYLYYFEEYSIKEISVLLKRNQSTIRTQLCKGRERLKKRLTLREECNNEEIDTRCF